MQHRVVRVALVLATAAVILPGPAHVMAQMAPQHAALITMRDAVNRGEAGRYAAVYSPSASIVIYGTAELSGRAAIAKHEVDLLAQFPGARFELYEVWHAGRQVAAHYAVNAPTPSKQVMGHEGLLFFTFNAAGEIEREHRYQDSLTPMAQLGALSNAPRRPIPVLESTWRSHDAGGAAGPGHVAAARHLLAALHRGQRGEVMAALSAAATIDELMLSEPFTGAGGAERWLEAIGAFADSTFDIATIYGAGQHVLIEGVLHARIDRPFGLIKPSAQRISVHRALAIEFEHGGRVRGIKAFMNGKELAEAAGQWPIR